jgi:hypothetical protein
MSALGMADEIISEQTGKYVLQFSPHVLSETSQIDPYFQYRIFQLAYKKFVINCYKTFDKLQVELVDTFGDPEKL